MAIRRKLRKVLSNLVFLTIIMLVSTYLILGWMKSYSINSDTGIRTERTEKKKIINDSDNTEWDGAKNVLLYSLVRSGSTWCFKMLHSMMNGVFFSELVEYIHMIDKDSHKPIKQAYALKEFYRKIWKCEFSKGFLEFFFNRRVPMSDNLIIKNTTLLDMDKNMKLAKNLCKESEYRVIREHKSLFDHYEELLQASSLGKVKMLYLFRDPRGSITSMETLLELGSPFCPYPDKICAKSRYDMSKFKHLKELYPDQIYLIRYEDLVRNLRDEAMRIYQFLTDSDGELPPRLEEFIRQTQTDEEQEIRTTKDMIFNVTSRSSDHWMEWRSIIKEEKLVEINKECSDVITDMGFHLYDSIGDIRDLSKPIISVEKCSQIPC